MGDAAHKALVTQGDVGQEHVKVALFYVNIIRLDQRAAVVMEMLAM